MGTIRGQSLRYPLFVDDDAVFVSSTRTTSLILRSRNDVVTKVPVADDVVWASACGQRIVAIKARSARTEPVWMDATGKTIGSVESVRPGDVAVSPLCSPDGRTMFYSALGQSQEVRRCDGAGCRVIVRGEASELALSGDGRRLAFVAAGNRGQLIRWISADGSGPAHEIAESRHRLSSPLVERKGHLGLAAQGATGRLDGDRHGLGPSHRSDLSGDA